MIKEKNAAITKLQNIGLIDFTFVLLYENR